MIFLTKMTLQRRIRFNVWRFIYEPQGWEILDTRYGRLFCLISRRLPLYFVLMSGMTLAYLIHCTGFIMASEQKSLFINVNLQGAK